MHRIHRRHWLRGIGIGLGGLSASGWLPALADQIAGDPQRRRHCIVLWMNGGPSQMDTFDLKPGHANGGPFQEIATNVPGVRFSEHLPRLATHADKLAIVRSLSTKEGDHGRGTHLVRTGHVPMGATRHPSIGAALGKALGTDQDPLPRYVSIAPYRAFNRAAFGPGYLGPRYAPLVVGATDVPGPSAAAAGDGEFAELKIEAIRPSASVSDSRQARRMALWEQLQQRFSAQHAVGAVQAHTTVYGRAVTLMNSKAAEAFDLERENAADRARYGNGLFGQGCLMARRLVEQGVPFVEVSLGGSGDGTWDTHSNNFETVQSLSAQLDAGWASLLEDLDARGLLQSTTILWIGEFGRTPQINGSAGRDHFPQAWTCVFSGGGIAGGHVHGQTSADGGTVTDGKVDVRAVLATLCAAVGVSPDTKNISASGRPLPIVDGNPIREILA